MEDLSPNVPDIPQIKLSKLWNFLSDDPIVLQSFLPCFDHIFTTGFSMEVWQSVIEKLGKKGLWHVSIRRWLSCRASTFLDEMVSFCWRWVIVFSYLFILMLK